MYKTQFLLSIVIPTKNRQEYAYESALQVLNATNDNVQLVIQDNSDNDSLYSKIQFNFFENRIKYNYIPESLSFTDNFSEGIRLSDGKYICFIGDDDGINPEIIDIVEYANRNDIEAIVPEISLSYIWPDTGIKYFSKDDGNLLITSFNSKVEFYDTKKEVIKLLNYGGQKYLNLKLVKMYHGIFTKSSFEKVKKITGKYIGGLSPDIYSSLTLSLVINKVLKINYPLTIPGVCKQSGAGQAATNNHIGKLESAPHLNGHKDYKWSKNVPRYYSVETIWADSAMAALRDMKEYNLLDKFNIFTLTAYCLLNGREFKNEIFINLKSYCEENSINLFNKKLFLLIAFIKGPYFDFLKKILKKIFQKKNFKMKYHSINNIRQAEKKFQDYLIERNKSVKQIILNLEKVIKK
jgi:glycosyltransferase involved in cell wall biosynthesis